MSPRDSLRSRLPATPSPEGLSKPQLALVLAAILFSYLATIGFFPMSEPDEARYAEIPREMLERGDWITPYLNHVKYFEKPPLLYWLVAATYSVFGFHEVSARLWPALLSFLGMAVTYALGRSMWSLEIAALGVAVLAASPLYFGLSQVLNLDMAFSVFLAVAASGFWFAYANQQRRRSGTLLFYVGLGFAVLTKGPVALVLMGGILGGFVLVRREWSLLRWLLSPGGVFAFLALVLPWHLLVGWRNPEFFEFYIVDQHFKRYLAPHEHREPAWFFLPVLLGGAAPWTVLALFLPATWRQALGRLLRFQASAATQFLVLWVAVIFAFFSLSGSKLATYILPLFPPAALLLARCLQHGLDPYPRFPRHASVAITAFGATLLVVALLVTELVDDPNGPTIASRLCFAGFALALMALLAWRAAHAGRKGEALAFLVVAVLCLQVASISARGLARSYKTLGEAIGQRATREDLVVSYGHFTQGIPLYSGRRVTLVGSRSELEFGSRQVDPEDYFWSGDAELEAHWRSDRRLFLVINRVELEPLRQRLLPPPREIAGEGKKVVVVNFADGIEN